MYTYQRNLNAVMSLRALARHQGKALQSYLLKAVCVCTLCLVAGAVNADIFSVTQDTYVSGSNPSSTYGSGSVLRVRTYGPTNSYIMFDVSSVSGKTIESAILKFDVTQVTKAGVINVRLVNGNWSESSLTYNNQPALSNTAASITIAATDVGKTVSVDVTSIVQSWANGAVANYGLALTPNNINMALGSKEGNLPAKLDVTVSSGVPQKTHVNVPTDFATVQLAIDNATVTWCPPDALRCAITIAAGEFGGFSTENLNWPAPHLTIKGSGENITYITSVVEDEYNDGLEIRDLTLRSDPNNYDRSILFSSNGVLLANITADGHIICSSSGGHFTLKDVQAKSLRYSICHVTVIGSRIEDTSFSDGSMTATNSQFGSISTDDEPSIKF